MSEHGSQPEFESPNQDGHVANCLKAIDEYRGRNISKWEAITQISTAIQSATASTDNEQRSTAGDTYLAMLDEHDRLLTSAGSRGQHGIEQDSDEPNEHQENTNGEARGKRSCSPSRSESPTPKRRKF